MAVGFAAPAGDGTPRRDRHAARGGGAGEPGHVFERIEAEADRIGDTAVEMRTGEAARLQLIAVEHALPRAEGIHHELRIGGEITHHRRAVCERDIALAGAVGVDAFLLQQIADQGDGVVLRLVEGARVFQSVGGDDLLPAELRAAHAAETAVAPGSAPAGIAALQHHRLDAVFLGEVIGGGKPGIAAADDRDIRLDVTLQRRVFRRRFGDGIPPPARHRRRGIERGRVVEVFHRGLADHIDLAHGLVDAAGAFPVLAGRRRWCPA